MTSEALVIGYGNPLRGDDAVGRHVAAAVDGWRRPGVRALAVHQLTPELSESIAAARVVFFVDACRGGPAGQLYVQPLRAGGATDATGHTGDPRALLALAGALYGARPPAWLVAVPGTNFDLGEGLSPAAADAMAVALRWIGERLERGLAVS